MIGTKFKIRGKLVDENMFTVKINPVWFDCFIYTPFYLLLNSIKSMMIILANSVVWNHPCDFQAIK